MQPLIAGPTPEERTAGYYSELNSLFSGASQCPSLGPVGGADFTLTLNTKGTTAEQGTATLKFCRATLSPGIGADARVLANLRATLLQFATIKKVVILHVQGNCFRRPDDTTPLPEVRPGREVKRCCVTLLCERPLAPCWSCEAIVRSLK